MTKFNSAMLVTIYHLLSFVCISIMIIFSYIGVNSLLSQSFDPSENLLLNSAYNLAQSFAVIISSFIMMYPIVNWSVSIHTIYHDEILSLLKWICTKTALTALFISGGLDAFCKRKDTP